MAQALFDDIMQNGWDETCCGSTPGGVWWDTAHTQKATASNAGPVIAGVLLHQLAPGGCDKCLSFAQMVYDFWWQHMVNATSHQVCDHMDAHGQQLWWRFTYNEGLMIGAGISLWQATGNVTYLQQSQQVAAFQLANEVANTSAGAQVANIINTAHARAHRHTYARTQTRARTLLLYLSDLVAFC